MIGSNNTIRTKRMVTVSGKDSYPTGYKLKDIECYIEPASPDVVNMYENVTAYELFTCLIEDDLDIIISDKVEDKDGNEYIVKGLTNYKNNSDVTDEMELVLYKKYAPDSV